MIVELADAEHGEGEHGDGNPPLVLVHGFTARLEAIADAAHSPQ